MRCAVANRDSILAIGYTEIRDTTQTQEVSSSSIRDAYAAGQFVCRATCLLLMSENNLLSAELADFAVYTTQLGFIEFNSESQSHRVRLRAHRFEVRGTKTKACADSKRVSREPNCSKVLRVLSGFERRFSRGGVVAFGKRHCDLQDSPSLLTLLITGVSPWGCFAGEQAVHEPQSRAAVVCK